MKLLRWLWPGLFIKRWFFVFAAGLALFTAGWAVVLDPITLIRFDVILRDAVRWLTGLFLPPRVIGVALIGLGLAVVAWAAQGAFRSVTSVLLPERKEKLSELIVRRRHADRGPRIVAIGGGTGLSTLVRGLKRFTSNLTAIVTVTDDGGSSGRLIGELGMPPPGDIRNVLVALADEETLMADLLQYRFDRGSLQGHTLGNLLIGALNEMTGDFERAVAESSRVLAVRGRVLPATAERVQLVATMADGTQVAGETAITAARGVIRRLSLQPEAPRPVAAALEAIAEADIIVLGPGSLYTSVMPHLLIPALRDAIMQSPALTFYVVNVMTQPGETDGYDAADHVRALIEHARPGIIDVALVNTATVDPQRAAPYHAQGATLVAPVLDKVQALGVRPLPVDVVSASDLVRHDPERLAIALLRAWMRLRPQSSRRVFDDLLLNEQLRVAFNRRRT